MNHDQSWARRLITVMGITFGIVSWGLLLSSFLVSCFGGNYRLFDKHALPVIGISWGGTIICGVAAFILKQGRMLGWSLIASAVAAFMFALLMPEL